jgi:NAD(P)-dependent dehydrogenase (short-subunit alcohol dehydrogenase family)
MADPASIDAAVAVIEGPIDALLNIAGLPGTVAPELIMRVNTLGLRHITQALFDRIQHGGAIVNVASIAGVNWARHLKDIDELLSTPSYDAGVAWCAAHSMDGNTAYHFSKECVVVYTMRMAGPALARGLRCNSVSPGPVATPLLPNFKEQAGSGQIEWVIDGIGRAAEPGEIAEVVKYLATGPASFVNGRDLIVDRGFSSLLKNTSKLRDVTLDESFFAA